MNHLVVVERSQEWLHVLPGMQVVFSRHYLTQSEYSQIRGVQVINLCKSYRYQSMGYYVSLLAEARGHKPFPGIATIQDMKSMTIVRYASEELDAMIQRALAHLRSDEFVLSVYFGRNLAKRYDRLASRLFSLFRAPCLRAVFTRGEKWELQSIKPIPAGDIPVNHRDFFLKVVRDYISHLPRWKKPKETRYDLAILHNPDETSPPSDSRAIRKFVKAAEALDFDVEVVDKEDYGRLAEFDALFIRETTSVNHHTYRFARRAAAEGLVVIDDPGSILRCTNKIYLAELLTRHKISIPTTLMIKRDNLDIVPNKIGFPCILKQPDSSFSQGVFKIHDFTELQKQMEILLERSEFIIAQEFLPTQFDWRVGVLAGEPLFACKYHMANHHWQIVKRDRIGRMFYGDVDTIPVAEAPKRVIRTALKAADLIGDGLYGVDIKESRGKCFVIEVNENPNIDAGYEDAVLKDDLYNWVMRVFLQRIEEKKRSQSK